MSFSKIFQILFTIGSTFPFLIPECLNNSQWWFSSSVSTCEDRRRVFSSISYPLSQRFVILACFHPLVIVLIVRILFTYPEQFKSLLSLLSEVHQFRFIHSQLSVIILQSYRCFVQVISNQFMIPSFSCI